MLQSYPVFDKTILKTILILGNKCFEFFQNKNMSLSTFINKHSQQNLNLYTQEFQSTILKHLEKLFILSMDILTKLISNSNTSEVIIEYIQTDKKVFDLLNTFLEFTTNNPNIPENNYDRLYLILKSLNKSLNFNMYK